MKNCGSVSICLQSRVLRVRVCNIIKTRMRFRLECEYFL